MDIILFILQFIYGIITGIMVLYFLVDLAFGCIKSKKDFFKKIAFLLFWPIILVGFLVIAFIKLPNSSNSKRSK